MVCSSRCLLAIWGFLAASAGAVAPACAAVRFRRGDPNADGHLNLSDPVFTLLHLFRSGEAPSCLDAADANDDGALNLSDPVHLLNHLFRGGSAPPAPAPACGLDPTPDPLDCARYPACAPAGAPALVGFTLAPNGRQAHLVYDGPLGFRRGASIVRLHGRRLGAVTQILFSDGFGQTRSTGWFRLLASGEEGGLDALEVDLHDERNDVRLLFVETRDNLGVAGWGPDGTSNRIEIPVAAIAEPEGLGAVVSSVEVPAGVASGAVRVRYTLYDLVVQSAWALEVDFSPDGGATWLPARPDSADPEHDGTSGLLPGPFARESGSPALPGRGTPRTFSWDGLEDPEFLALNDPRLPRQWTLRFRLRLRPETPPPASLTDHTVETPSFEYLFLPEGARERTVTETFDDTRRLDAALTTASWGPPASPSVLAGTFAAGPDPFGQGTAALELEPLEGLPEGARAEYVFDTTRLEVRLEVTGEGISESRPIAFENPGQARGEFHLARLGIAAGVRAAGRGERPLVIRLAGEGPSPPDDAIVFEHLGVLDLSGEPGEDGEAPGGPGGPGRGGRGGPGAGGGGDGGFATLDPFVGAGLLAPKVTAAADGSPGEGPGGGGGATPAAVHFDWTRPQASLFPAGSGGGGGHREPGAPGGYRSNPIPEYRPPRSGAGGPVRGDVFQALLTRGAGGGGGGGSLSVLSSGTGRSVTTAAGAGGGGGGGALQVVARGSTEIAGDILAGGGAGGSAWRPPQSSGAVATGGPGGGGSGGTILLQAAGPVRIDRCERLQTPGGPGGVSESRTQDPGGAGAPGWIRIESARGEAPFCGALSAFTRLTGDVAEVRMQTLMVESTAGFPERGVLLVDAERIGYGRKSETDFLDLTRGLGGTEVVSHRAGALVVLEGTIVPLADPEVFPGGELSPAPDPAEPGEGADGALTLFFLEGIDPETGEPPLDPETGEPVSVWRYDTGTAELRDPAGDLVLRAAAAASRPGYLDLARLEIPERVVLRATGPEPLEISVAGEAHVAGAIDVSGSPGSALAFDEASPEAPLRGTGGAGGPGGGAGGAGGTVEFLDGDVENKAPENTRAVDGAAGQVPAAVAARFPEVTPAGGGRSLGGTGCGEECTETGGGGGGGGHLHPGGDGNEGFVAPAPPGTRGGTGGAAYGDPALRPGGELLLAGGAGGGGGGASAHVSRAYAERRIGGEYAFRGAARFAPGTGGGGGGGVLRLVAGSLHLSPQARLRARGGEAPQSIDLGGNGGGGAGGTVFIAVIRALAVEPGALIDVRGGRANRLPPRRGNVFLYEGNARQMFFEGTPREVDPFFGGPGGSGSPGRVRIEARGGSALLAAGRRELSAGSFLAGAARSTAFSTAIPLDLGGASLVGLSVLEASVRYRSLPRGTRAVVLWEAARLDPGGGAGPFLPPVADPRSVQDPGALRFSVVFFSDPARGAAPELDAISFRYGRR